MRLTCRCPRAPRPSLLRRRRWVERSLRSCRTPSLRSRRAYKPALSHDAALRVMLETAGGQFDPQLLQAFQRCAPDFDRVYREMPD